MSPRARRDVQGDDTGKELELTNKVRIQGIIQNVTAPTRGKKKPGKTYTVRWSVDGERFPSTFQTRPLAERFRGELLAFVNRGVPFDKVSGLPEPWARRSAAASWYQHSVDFVDMKWDGLSPKARQSVAESLARATVALTTTTRGAPDPAILREALYTYVYVAPARQGGPPPDHLAAAVKWVSEHTVSMTDFKDHTQGAALVRAALNGLSTLLDGTTAAPNTISRRRAVLHACLDYGIEKGYLGLNPIDRVKWSAPKSSDTVDLRTVVNPQQAKALLDAVATLGALGLRLVAFFGCMYYAGMRPSEALHLKRSNLISLPDTGWGMVLLEMSNPRSGRQWTNDGGSREPRQLKHRARADTRPIPLHPELVRILRRHLELHPVGPDGLIFLGPRGGLLAEWAYLSAWHRAREIVLTPEEVASPLAAVPYSLRHACVSTWLNAGVPPTQVAAWAGHSVEVLLRVYAKCIVGQDELARRRIEEAIPDAGNPTEKTTDEAGEACSADTEPPTTAPQETTEGDKE